MLILLHDFSTSMSACESLHGYNLFNFYNYYQSYGGFDPFFLVAKLNMDMLKTPTNLYFIVD